MWLTFCLIEHDGLQAVVVANLLRHPANRQSGRFNQVSQDQGHVETKTQILPHVATV